MKKEILVLLILVVICGLVCACTNKIQFNRESAAKKFVTDSKTSIENDSVKKTKGGYIYKSETQNKIKMKDMNFGPSDLDFDIKVRF